MIEHVDFICVPVTDIARSVAWYRDTLGAAQTTQEGDDFPEFKLGDNAFLYLVRMENLGGEWSGPHSAPIALRVADVAGARQALEGRGVEFEGEIRDSGICRMTFFKDPDGNQLMFHHRYVPA